MTHIFNERTKIDGEVDLGAEISRDKLSVVDIRALALFEQMLITLKKIEYHLSIASDTNLNDEDV